jgi:competence protein ComEC
MVGMSSSDPIKRRLDLLDEQLMERRSLLRNFLQLCPLIFAAVGLITGIARGNVINIPVWLALLLFVANTAFCAYLLKKKLPSRRIEILAFLVFTSFLLLGVIRFFAFNNPPQSDISHYVTQDRQLAILRGTVITDIRHEDRDVWEFGRFLPSNPSSSFYLNIDQIKTETAWASITGKVRINSSASLTKIFPGDRVEIYCTLSRFPNASNPGQFEIARYMKRKSVLFGATVNSTGGVKLLSTGSSPLTKLRYKLKTLANQALFSDSQIESENAGLLAALLLGTRSNINTQTYEAFRKTGLSHFISLSGMHMAILAAILWWACRFTGLPKPWRAAICIVLIVAYVLAIPPRPPSLRAAIICCFFFLSVIVRRKPNSLNTLSLAAIILLLAQPASLFQPGWQLSFSCVAGIILFYKKIEHFITSHTTDRIPFFNREHEKFPAIVFHVFCTKGRDLLAAGLAAWIGGSGVMLYHFSSITPLACVWTVTVYIFIILILPLGYFKILLAHVLPTVSMLLAIILDYLSEGLIRLVNLIAQYDFSQIVIGKVPLIIIAGFYVFLILLRFWHAPKPLLRKTVLVSMAVAIVFSLITIKHASKRSGDLELTCLDVGHGQAIAVFFPDGTNILFDTGSLSAKNCGASIVVPFLQTKGISKLDAIIASHEDIDHINGIPEVISRYKTASVFANAAMLNRIESSSKIRHLNNCLSEISSPLKPIADAPGKYITAIWPTNEVCIDPKISTNNKSQVSMIEYAGKKILICSDIEIFAQTKIFEMYPDLTADIIVMPHHGSNSNLLENYAEKLGAKTAIISCARKRLQTTWHPTTRIKLYNTPTHGAITIKIKKNAAMIINTYK